MSANRVGHHGLRRLAFALAALLSLLCLVIPGEAIDKVDPLGIGQGLGVGEAEAANLTSVTVDSSTSDTAVMSPSQRKLFYAAGRFWVFYTDGSELVYKSSSGGLSWSSRSASLGASSVGDSTSVHFDGTYVHYVRTTGTNGGSLYYRRGVPIADGTISWSAAEQEAVLGVVGVRYWHPSVSADSSGHALVAYHYEKQNGKAGEGPYVTKSGNSDGSWGSTPLGFPYELASDSESDWYTTVHGLTADKIAVTYADQTEIKGVSVATYNGANWNSIQASVSNPQSGNAYSSVAEGDDVHIALLTTTTYDLLYCKYSYSTNTLSPEYAILRSATPTSWPALAMNLENDLYCFWPGAPTANHIYYTRMLSGVWQAGYTDWLAEANLVANGGLSAFYDQGSSEYLGLAWETGAVSPYEIRFAAVSQSVPPDQPDNMSPVDGTIGWSLTPTLQSSDFSDPDAGDIHAASQWQITVTSGNYVSPVFDSGADGSNLLNLVVPPDRLSHSTAYYWHVRYQDNHGDWSIWSAETSFSTDVAPNRPPDRPANVLPVGNALGQSLRPILQSSEFLDPDTADSHYASQWQVTDAPADYSSPAFDSQTDNADLLSIMVPSGKLGYSTTYYWRVRHEDNHGDWSDWSSETAFTTAAQPQANFSVSRVESSDGSITVLFTNLSSGGVSPLTSAWDFDADGTIDSTAWQPTHCFPDSGTYAVALSVKDAAGDGDVEVKTGCLVILSPSGAVAESADGQVRLEFPPNSVPDDGMLTIGMTTTSGLPQVPTAFVLADTCFVILAQDADGQEIVYLSRPSTITVRYSERDVARANGHPKNLVLAYWDEAAGRWKVLKTRVDTEDMTVSASTTHLSTWAVLVRPSSASDWILPWFCAVVAMTMSLAIVMGILRKLKPSPIAREKPTSGT